jgi:hypothetical protein
VAEKTKRRARRVGLIPVFRRLSGMLCWQVCNNSRHGICIYLGRPWLKTGAPRVPDRRVWRRDTPYRPLRIFATGDAVLSIEDRARWTYTSGRNKVTSRSSLERKIRVLNDIEGQRIAEVGVELRPSRIRIVLDLGGVLEIFCNAKEPRKRLWELIEKNGYYSAVYTAVTGRATYGHIRASKYRMDRGFASLRFCELAE